MDVFGTGIGPGGGRFAAKGVLCLMLSVPVKLWPSSSELPGNGLEREKPFMVRLGIGRGVVWLERETMVGGACVD